jgi:hypothetical protein
MPLQKFKGVDRTSTQVHITPVEDDDQCNRSMVDGNEHTPRGVEENDDYASVRPSSSKWLSWVFFPR